MNLRPLALGLVAAGLTSASISAVTVFSTDFEAVGLSAEFSGGGTLQGTQGLTIWPLSALGFGNQFLRNDSGGNPAPASILTLTGLPTHTSIDLGFLLVIIDSWDGNSAGVGPDLFNVRIDGALIFSETFSNFDINNQSYVPAGSLMVLPADLGLFSSWPDTLYDMRMDSTFASIPHTGSTLTIEWFASGTGWQAGSDESWAIDNVTVTLNGVSTGVTDASQTVVLLGLASMALFVCRRAGRAGVAAV